MSNSYRKEYADLCAETFSGQDEAQQRALDVLGKADEQIDALRASRDKLAGLLRDWDAAFEHEDGGTWVARCCEVRDRARAALAEVGREGGEGADGRAERKP